MTIDRIDHLVLTVRVIAATCDFYSRVLGMEVVTFGQGRKAPRFGQQKINLHAAGNEFDPKAARPPPGSADVCFLSRIPLDEVVAHRIFGYAAWLSKWGRWSGPGPKGLSCPSTSATRTGT